MFAVVDSSDYAGPVTGLDASTRTTPLAVLVHAVVMAQAVRAALRLSGRAADRQPVTLGRDGVPRV
jgi:hypothetical protein